VYPFLFSGRLTVAKQSTDGYTTYLLKHNFCLYLSFQKFIYYFLKATWYNYPFIGVFFCLPPANVLDFKSKSLMHFFDNYDNSVNV